MQKVLVTAMHSYMSLSHQSRSAAEWNSNTDTLLLHIPVHRTCFLIKNALRSYECKIQQPVLNTRETEDPKHWMFSLWGQSYVFALSSSTDRVPSGLGGLLQTSFVGCIKSVWPSKGRTLIPAPLWEVVTFG